MVLAVVQRWETTFELAHSRRNVSPWDHPLYDNCCSAERWAALKIISSVLFDRCNSWITIREIRLWFPGTTMSREFLWETHGTPGISICSKTNSIFNADLHSLRVALILLRVRLFASWLESMLYRRANLCTKALLRDRLSADWELIVPSKLISLL